MYFKNESKYQVGVRTKKTLLFVNPGKYVSIPDYDIITISENLTAISEEEYTKHCDENKKVKNKKTNVEKENKEITQETKEEKESDEIKELKNDTPKKEDVTIVQEKKIKKNTSSKTNSKGRKTSANKNENIEKRIEILKEEWIKAEKPKTKETIAKQIKELQEKLK